MLPWRVAASFTFQPVDYITLTRKKLNSDFHISFLNAIAEIETNQ
jgi:hypothetical protein